MGKTCEPKAFSFQCMTKFTTKKKKKKAVLSLDRGILRNGSSSFACFLENDQDKRGRELLSPILTIPGYGGSFLKKIT